MPFWAVDVPGCASNSCQNYFLGRLAICFRQSVIIDASFMPLAVMVIPLLVLAIVPAFMSRRSDRLIDARSEPVSGALRDPRSEVLISL